MGRINNTPAGGAAYLARHLQMLRDQATANGADTLTVAAGDLIGASPLVAAAFHDEPTIEAMNQMGLDVASVGNHEFDEGWQELLRMQRGGCLDDGDGENNQNSCPDPSQPFEGADVRYLSANVFWENQGNRPLPTLFPATKVVKVQGVKVGFIGMTLEGTPAIVTKSGIEGLRFADEVETANALVPKLRSQGVQAIVVLLHEGGVPTDASAYEGCTGVSGAGMDIARNLSPQIDVVVSGHTHQPYNCTVTDPAGNPRLITSASSFGRIVTDVHLLNPGGIRADLVENAAGEVTYGAAFTVQPLNNFDVSMDLTGQQILDLLEEQWSGPNQTAPKVLQVSGITYAWDPSQPPGQRVVASSVRVDADRNGVAGEPLDPAATYRVVANSFLSDGGDNLPTFVDGTNKLIGGLDIDALTAYLGAHEPYTPTPTDRINVP